MNSVTQVVIVTVVSLFIIVQLYFVLHDIPQVFSFPNNIECEWKKIQIAQLQTGY